MRRASFYNLFIVALCIPKAHLFKLLTPRQKIHFFKALKTTKSHLLWSRGAVVMRVGIAWKTGHCWPEKPTKSPIMTLLSQTNSVFKGMKPRLTLSPIQQQSTLGNNLPDRWRTASTEAQTHYVWFCAWSYSLARSWWYLVFCKKTTEGNKD